ncbi:MAG TPA: DUF6600 domain-containing protein, partial [Acetobacteraceae bacterium]|nr:DUF6600 domain-containing protein [Acetobacteraceae bacterium]
MKVLTRIVRLAVAMVFAGGLAWPPPGVAQTPGETETEATDPPLRAGRLARIEGGVSFRAAAAETWQAGTVNFPLTAGNELRVAPEGGAAIDISGSRIMLAGGTELRIDVLDVLTATMTQPRGEMFLRLAALLPGESYTVRTPRGTVSISAAGRYGIAGGDAGAPTTVTVLDGSAQVNGADFGSLVRAGQTLRIAGETRFTASLGPAEPGAFLLAAAAEPLPGLPRDSLPAPAGVDYLPGAADLLPYGVWQAMPTYGTMWFPLVPQGWVPFRDGRWVYVAPWGWTWVDDAPWGFAPFHYGRWAYVGSRWGWVPYYQILPMPPPVFVPPVFVPPVYAPAVVSFIAPSPFIGWVPLGWREPFRPWYRASPAYLRRINRHWVPDVGRVTGLPAVPLNQLANRAAATVVPPAAMARSLQVAPQARPLPPQEFSRLRTIPAPPVRPAPGMAALTAPLGRPPGLAPAAPRRLPPLAPPGAPGGPWMRGIPAPAAPP